MSGTIYQIGDRRVTWDEFIDYLVQLHSERLKVLEERIDRLNERLNKLSQRELHDPIQGARTHLHRRLSDARTL